MLLCSGLWFHAPACMQHALAHMIVCPLLCCSPSPPRNLCSGLQQQVLASFRQVVAAPNLPATDFQAALAARVTSASQRWPLLLAQPALAMRMRMGLWTTRQARLMRLLKQPALLRQYQQLIMVWRCGCPQLSECLAHPRPTNPSKQRHLHLLHQLPKSTRSWRQQLSSVLSNELTRRRYGRHTLPSWQLAEAE